MTKNTKILNIIYGLTVIFFLLDSLIIFEIKSQNIKSFVYFGFLIQTPLILIWNFIFIEVKTKKIIGAIFPMIMIAFILVVGQTKIVFSTGAWQTQTILYQNKYLSFKTVEFQMQNVGALGYNQRTVEVFYLTPFFMITKNVLTDIDKKTEWVKVDKNINELGLKY